MPPLTSDVITVTVSVTRNLNPPIISCNPDNTVNINHDHEEDSRVTQIRATDEDDEVYYMEEAT